MRRMWIWAYLNSSSLRLTQVRTYTTRSMHIIIAYRWEMNSCDNLCIKVSSLPRQFLQAHPKWTHWELCEKWFPDNLWGLRSLKVKTLSFLAERSTKILCRVAAEYKKLTVNMQIIIMTERSTSKGCIQMASKAPDKFSLQYCSTQNQSWCQAGKESSMVETSACKAIAMATLASPQETALMARTTRFQLQSSRILVRRNMG